MLISFVVEFLMLRRRILILRMAILIFLDLLVSCLVAIITDNSNKICVQTGSSLGMQAQSKRATETRETILLHTSTN
jgi:hypothetical protein